MVSFDGFDADAKSHRSKARVHGQRQKGDLSPVGVAFLDIFGTSRPLSQKLKGIEIRDLYSEF